VHWSCSAGEPPANRKTVFIACIGKLRTEAWASSSEYRNDIEVSISTNMPSERFVKAVGLVGAAANWTIPIAVCHRFEEYKSAAAFVDSRSQVVHSPTQLTIAL
jgi:hypothetical protein